MADTKITALAAIATVDPAADVLPIVDISDTSMAASGTTKKVTSNQILGAGGTATLASATITGDLTVDTSTLKVDSTNNRVGIGTATPLVPLHAETTGTGTTAFANFVATFRSQAAGRDATLQFSDGTNQAAISMLSGALSFGTAGANTRYQIDGTGISTWSVSGTTAMTLNSTGLGIGASPSNYRLYVSAAFASGLNGAYIESGEFNKKSLVVNHTNPGVAVNLFEVQKVGTALLTLDASGNLLVGKTALSSATAGIQLEAVGAVTSTRSAGAAAYFNRLTSDGFLVLIGRESSIVGDISVTTTGTTFNSTSDYRLKEAVQPLVGGLARVSALKPSVYKWKANGSAGEGFLAHELAEVVPAAVTGEKDAVNADGSIKAQSIDMSRVVPILVAAIQELTARLQTLEAR